MRRVMCLATLGAWLLAVPTQFGSGNASAQSYSLSRTFNDPTVTGADEFGSSVAIDGNHVLIGASADDTDGSNAGQAHLYDATTGSLLQTFGDPRVTGFDLFGHAVAIDGNHVLIGAPDDNNGFDLGQAHLFDATTGNLLQTFVDPTVTTFDRFGSSVAIDGNHVLIGARGDDTHGDNVGQAHLFDATTGNLLHTFDDPTVTDGDSFGWSVAIDGQYVLIGAPRDETNGTGVGQTHLFDTTTGNLLRTFNDPTVSGIDLFGSSVAIDDNHVLIGAPSNGLDERNVSQAHLFDALTGHLLQTFNNPTMSGVDQFASSVAIDGNHVLIGAHYDDTSGRDVGQAHLFDTTKGNLLQTFGDPTVTERDEFGHSVAIDGNRVLIGAHYDDTIGRNVGQAHLFTQVPEPATSALAAIGNGSLVLARCRRQSRRSWTNFSSFARKLTHRGEKNRYGCVSELTTV